MPLVERPATLDSADMRVSRPQRRSYLVGGREVAAEKALFRSAESRHYCCMSRYRTTPAIQRVLAGNDVVLVGLFSAKDAGFEGKLDRLAVSVEAHGARVVRRYVQRRGVSHGGASKMTSPLSRRTLLSLGKAQEVADACRAAEVGAAVSSIR